MNLEELYLHILKNVGLVVIYILVSLTFLENIIKTQNIGLTKNNSTFTILTYSYEKYINHH